MTRNRKYLFFVLIIVFVFILTILYHNFSGLKEFKETHLYFDTFVTIHCLYNKNTDINPIINTCWQRLTQIQRDMNSQSKSGDIAHINRAGSNSVQVRDDVYRLIRDSIYFSKQTDGAFDITIVPLLQLWKTAQEINQLPDSSIINKVIKNVGYEFIELGDDHHICLMNNVKIDLGGIAKGYAVDEVVKILKQHKIQNFMIDAGGDMFLSGKNKKGRLWKIGIQDPLNLSEISDRLNISNMAITTSGNYHRFFTINEKRYSHIINPKTGYPQENVISATVIAPSATAADAYSTALSILGAKKGIEIINSLRDVEAMIIEMKIDKPMTYESKGYNKYQ